MLEAINVFSFPGGEFCKIMRKIFFKKATKRQKQKKKKSIKCSEAGTKEEKGGKAQNKSKSQSLISRNPSLCYSFSRPGSKSLAAALSSMMLLFLKPV